jgi:hypothetical protein
MQEAIINEKTELLRSLTTKENFIQILKETLIPLWNKHSNESFDFICKELDKNIINLNTKNK